ncbi:hypothetical protein CsSME_00033985 [Camellia sinensis var. sinensis]
MKCFFSAIEKREKSVRLTAQLIGKTEVILKIFEQHELLFIILSWRRTSGYRVWVVTLYLHNADQFASIEEWRAKMGQANPSASLSSSCNDSTPSDSSELAINIESKA